MDFKKQLLNEILGANRDNANKIIDAWASKHSYREVLPGILEPVLIQIGDLWKDEKVSLAQGYVAVKIAEDVLNKILQDQDTDESPQVKKGPVVIANIEDDYHSLGRKMVGTFLRANGWEVVDMGNDVPAEDIVDKCEEIGARVVGVSAMMFTTARNIKSLRECIDQRGLEDTLKLAVGGAVFKLRPSLVDDVGGDGTAPSALQAPELFEQLWKESEQGV
ncbi:MAG: cobalamin-dependent protein [Candidatus Cloacimonetes bacterium]|nr:cobalamin-dependent protein [Candidatus Cloacimonadota bacterium]